VDHQRHEALVAIDPLTGRGVGVARYVCDPHDPRQAEIACAVTDLWQDRGVGSALVDRLTVHARENAVELFSARTFVGNRRARRLLTRVSDVVDEERDGGVLVITTRLHAIAGPSLASVSIGCPNPR
jgi:RimJ/RimL family protein N-acetyltransferase